MFINFSLDTKAYNLCKIKGWKCHCSIKMSLYTCLNCNNFKVYNTQGSLTRHLKEVHGFLDLHIQSYPMETFNYKCLEGCSVSFEFAKDLRQHLLQKHAILMDQAIFEFEDEDDFSNWMANLNSNPIQRYSITEEQKKNDHLTIKHYSCLYSQTDHENSEKRASKLHTLCTSEIIVIKNSRTKLIVVTCFKTHYGHSKNTEYIKSPTNCLTRRAIHITSNMSERLINNSDQIIAGTGTKRQLLKGTTKNAKKNKCKNKVLYSEEQTNRENYASNSFSNSALVGCMKNNKYDKISLKKDIIYFLQELSGNDFEKYDVNTLNNVKETLQDCCNFLNSYEIPEEEAQSVDHSTPLQQSQFPPSLLWFSEKYK